MPCLGRLTCASLNRQYSIGLSRLPSPFPSSLLAATKVSAPMGTHTNSYFPFLRPTRLFTLGHHFLPQDLVTRLVTATAGSCSHALLRSAPRSRLESQPLPASPSPCLPIYACPWAIVPSIIGAAATTITAIPVYPCSTMTTETQNCTISRYTQCFKRARTGRRQCTPEGRTGMPDLVGTR